MPCFNHGLRLPNNNTTPSSSSSTVPMPSELPPPAPRLRGQRPDFSQPMMATDFDVLLSSDSTTSHDGAYLALAGSDTFSVSTHREHGAPCWPSQPPAAAWCGTTTDGRLPFIAEQFRLPPPMIPLTPAARHGPRATASAGTTSSTSASAAPTDDDASFAASVTSPTQTSNASVCGSSM